MNNLWSPWRSQYINSFKDEQPSSACFLCDAFAGGTAAAGQDAQTLVVARREHCFVVMNLYPYNAGHIMVVPNHHVGRLHLLADAELSNLMMTVRESEQALERAFQPDGINIGANLGRAAGAGVPDHIHFHLVPRWNGDTNFMPIFAEVKVISEQMEKTRQKLVKVFEHE